MSNLKSSALIARGLLAAVFLMDTMAFACGGGVMPYIPSSTGAGSNNTSSGQFFIIDKGTTTTMLDLRSLQPVFRNVINTGNERTDQRQKFTRDTAVSAADSTKRVLAQCPYHTTADSLQTAQKKKSRRAEPVLNVHKLH